MTESRKTAYQVLLRCAQDMAYSNIALPKALSASQMNSADKALTSELVYGTMERQLTLDFYISQVSERAITNIDRKVLILLRMAIYQLFYLDRIPPHSACNEAVEMTKDLAAPSAAGFVNAVLRNILRSRKEIEKKLADSENLSIRYSVSDSIVSLFITEYGREQTEKILEGLTQRRGLTLSVNTVKVTTEQAAKMLNGNLSEFDTVKIERQGEVDKLPGYDNGLYFVQDIASAKAVTMLAPKQDETVIDVCSAPGGKSLKAAILMKGTGKVLSRDIHVNKLKLLENSAKRLVLENIETEAFDASMEDLKHAESADRVICDVPCSGLGVISKKPEIRYKNTADFERLPEIQYGILTQSVKLLKKGGRLLYSTCTVNPAENNRVVKRFLEEQKGYSLKSEEQILPDSNTDGFYIAILEKNIV